MTTTEKRINTYLKTTFVSTTPGSSLFGAKGTEKLIPGCHCYPVTVRGRKMLAVQGKVALRIAKRMSNLELVTETYKGFAGHFDVKQK